eukprot:356419-Pleurochrysis_carterae.AAC.1
MLILSVAVAAGRSIERGVAEATTSSKLATLLDRAARRPACDGSGSAHDERAARAGELLGDSSEKTWRRERRSVRAVQITCSVSPSLITVLRSRRHVPQMAKATAWCICVASLAAPILQQYGASTTREQQGNQSPRMLMGDLT